MYLILVWVISYNNVIKCIIISSIIIIFLLWIQFLLIVFNCTKILSMISKPWGMDWFSVLFASKHKCFSTINLKKYIQTYTTAEFLFVSIFLAQGTCILSLSEGPPGCALASQHRGSASPWSVLVSLCAGLCCLCCSSFSSAMAHLLWECVWEISQQKPENTNDTSRASFLRKTKMSALQNGRTVKAEAWHQRTAHEKVLC